MTDALLVAAFIAFLALLLVGTENRLDHTLELAQCFVVFSLAVSVNLRVVRARPFVVARLLLICLPLMILLGFAIGLLVIPTGTFVELFLLSTVAAASDPGGLRALSLIRGRLESQDVLRLECILSLLVLIPAALLLMSLSRGMLQGGYSIPLSLGRDLGAAALTGTVTGYVGSHLVRQVDGRMSLRWSSQIVSSCIVATATFLLARAFDSDGILASLLAGLILNRSMGEARAGLGPTRITAEMISLGAGIFFLLYYTFQVLPWIDWRITCYSGLGILVVRPLSASLCLCRSDLEPSKRAELSFFKNSGLIGAILAIQAQSLELACAPTIIATVVCSIWLTLAMHLASRSKLPIVCRFPPHELSPGTFRIRFLGVLVVSTMFSIWGAQSLFLWAPPEELQDSADRQAVFLALASARAAAIPICTATLSAIVAPAYRKASYFIAASGAAMSFAFWMTDLPDLLNWMLAALEKVAELIRESVANWKMYLGE